MADQLERGHKPYYIPASVPVLSFACVIVGTFVSAIVFAILLRGDVNTILVNQQTDRSATDSLRKAVRDLKDDNQQLRYDLGFVPHLYAQQPAPKGARK